MCHSEKTHNVRMVWLWAHCSFFKVVLDNYFLNKRLVLNCFVLISSCTLNNYLIVYREILKVILSHCLVIHQKKIVMVSCLGFNSVF